MSSFFEICHRRRRWIVPGVLLALVALVLPIARLETRFELSSFYPEKSPVVVSR